MSERAYSVKEVSRIKTRELALDGDWQAAFGNPSWTERWMVSGQSASGKSSFVMQLAKKLCEYGGVLYMSLEEGVGLSFKERLARFKMDEVQGRLRIITDGSMEALRARLSRHHSAHFVIVDSYQFAGWSYEETMELVKEYGRKSFIFVSQEDKGRPMGKAAVRLKYACGVKIRTMGFRAYCQGRYIGEAAAYWTIWKEGAMRVWNEV